MVISNDIAFFCIDNNARAYALSLPFCGHLRSKARGIQAAL
jgi:hypothetical protein